MSHSYRAHPRNAELERPMFQVYFERNGGDLVIKDLRRELDAIMLVNYLNGGVLALGIIENILRRAEEGTNGDDD